jgi:hypothetical protein
VTNRNCLYHSSNWFLPISNIFSICYLSLIKHIGSNLKCIYQNNETVLSSKSEHFSFLLFIYTFSLFQSTSISLWEKHNRNCHVPLYELLNLSRWCLVHHFQFSNQLSGKETLFRPRETSHIHLWESLKT